MIARAAFTTRTHIDLDPSSAGDMLLHDLIDELAVGSIRQEFTVEMVAAHGEGQHAVR